MSPRRGPSRSDFGLFFTLAMGLGLPYLVLGTVSGSLAKLPRSGEWMEAVRRVFGFALLALAVWFLRPLLSGSPLRDRRRGPARSRAESGSSSSRRAGGTSPGSGPLRIVVAARASSAAGVLFALPKKARRQQLVIRGPTPRPPSRAAAGKPVMIDFAADWCLPCKELEHKTFTDPAVVAAGKGWVFLKADLTKTGSPEVEALKDEWKVLGVPTLIFLGPDGRETGERIVGFEPPESFVSRLER